MKTLNLKYFWGSRFWSLEVRWRHRSRDHWTRHMWFPIGGPLKSCISLAPLRKYNAPKILGSRPWPFGVTWGHRSRDHRTWRGHFPIGGQGWLCAYLACTKIRGFKDFRVTSLTFWSHVTSSVTWPSYSAWALSYWWSMMTMRLSCTDTEIRGFKDFGVTSLTFWGHVTSSVTWPFNSAHVVSYWWSIGTMRLSCTVTEI